MSVVGVSHSLLTEGMSSPKLLCLSSPLVCLAFLNAKCTNSVPLQGSVFLPLVCPLKYYFECRCVRCQEAFGVSLFTLNQYSLVELLDLFLCVLPTRLPVHTYAFVIYVGPSKREESKALGFSSEFLQLLASKRDAYYS